MHETTQMEMERNRLVANELDDRNEVSVKFHELELGAFTAK